MALSEFEIKKIEKAGAAFLAKHRPPLNIRSKLDLGWRLENQSVYIFEIQPVWNNPEEYQSLDIAKSTFVRSQGVWKLYWMRRDLKWHSYKPESQVTTIEQAFNVVSQDQYGCFFG
ncbi:DUF3024 domain-containing protein [Shewanella dokdonensis]|uniref:DUF3024 domain-containing protein n=1 Tax=Shewanella dokdonensis TaxID=712036 RepID=UPI00200CBC70|nr:DUF3024 domain-containing protein [Shewanella dokdonensis]MCL1074887.1 DUF3024 domain-containing protein [Shewanella dokdonensis]